jgi:branched-chain amino acid transport system permease protein
MMVLRRLPFTWIIIAACIIVIPFVTGNYVIGVMCFVAIYGALAVGMGVLLEHAGLMSLAHPTFFGLGAYVAGILSVQGIAPPWAGIIIAACFVALLSYLIGAPLLRLKGYYLACATFAVLVIVEICLAQAGSITGGHEGLMGIPPLSIAGFTLETDLHYYFLAWTLCLLTLWFMTNLMGSRTGRAIKSFSDSEVASRSMGVNIPQYKLKVFVLTSVMASIAGSVFCFYLRFTQPGIFGFPLLVELMTMLIIGGGKTLWGPLLGSFVTLWLRELIHMYLKDLLPRMTAEVDAIFFGLLIIAILIFMPGGLAGWVQQVAGAGKRVFGKVPRG